MTTQNPAVGMLHNVRDPFEKKASSVYARMLGEVSPVPHA